MSIRNRNQIKESSTLLNITPKIIKISFKLKDCDFIEFSKEFDLNNSTVYDMQYEISQKHGKTVTPSNIRIYTKIKDEFSLIEDFSISLKNLKTEEFYYDFEPISGSLLNINCKNTFN